MTALFAIVIAALAFGAGFVRGYHTPLGAKRSRAGWYGLGLMLALVVGMLAAAQMGQELAVYGFGFAIVLVLPVMLVSGIASAIGRAARRRKDAVR